jgi:type VI secretion system protein ImpB
MAGSFQNEIPAARINLKLDIGKGDAKKKAELPLKLLVMGDFTLREKNGRLSDREKININKNNFEQVMGNLNLKAGFEVPNRLSGNSAMQVDIDIKSMDSFKPESLAANIPALSRLLAARNLLKDLKSNLLDNREFRKRLEEILKTPEGIRSLHGELRKLVPESSSRSTPA